MKTFKKYYEDSKYKFMPFEEDPIVYNNDGDELLVKVGGDGNVNIKLVVSQGYETYEVDGNFTLDQLKQFTRSLVEIHDKIINKEIHEQDSIRIDGIDATLTLWESPLDGIELMLDASIYPTNPNKIFLNININMEDVDSIVNDLNNIL